ncbi:hypothetical protein BCR39DRAFT_502826 [Naematelia encephala]|uniref:Arrestin C-terminal-like domain-containing protein n=1 Tax=Naematelia encephala TaxID=71784 RepID=A0A1Y2BLB6_9TREE|nr:hypothetical protein BCR39DRAFT_502826 [Naematelia encephala]
MLRKETLRSGLPGVFGGPRREIIIQTKISNTDPHGVVFYVIGVVVLGGGQRGRVPGRHSKGLVQFSAYLIDATSDLDMTELTLIPERGSFSGRSYPHEGYLGLSDVICRGKIVTTTPKLARPLDASRVTVTGGPFGACVENVLWERTERVWTAPEDTAPVGDWEHPFQITVPPEAMDQAASALNIGEWKVAWRLEAAVHHRHIPHVGNVLTKAFSLNLYNHRVPDIPPLSPPAAITLGHEAYTTQLYVTAPPRAFGPGDILPISFHVRPEDPSTTIRKATITLIRQVEFIDKTPRRTAREVSPEASSRFNLFRKSSSPQPRLVRIPSDPASLDATDSARTVSAAIIETTTDRLEPGSGGSFWCTTAIELPSRGGRGWDMGETQRTKLVSVSYELKIKLHIRPAKARLAALDFAAIGVPVVIVTTSSAERAEAVGYEALASRVVQRKRTSTRRGLYMQEGTTDINHPATAMRTRSQGPPNLRIPITGIATDIKPILRKADHPPAEQSISFFFPPPAPASPPLVEPTITPPTPSMTLSPSISGPSLLLSPPSTTADVESDSTAASPLDRFQQTGRRISTTSTEEDDLQPSRSRQRLSSISAIVSASDHDSRNDFRPSLPSLSALGLGLPHVPARPRQSRPSTAPAYSRDFTPAFPPQFAVPRPVTSWGRQNGVIQPQQAHSQLPQRSRSQSPHPHPQQSQPQPQPQSRPHPQSQPQPPEASFAFGMDT